MNRYGHGQMEKDRFVLGDQVAQALREENSAGRRAPIIHRARYATDQTYRDACHVDSLGYGVVGGPRRNTNRGETEARRRHSVRAVLLTRDGYWCRYCGAPVIDGFREDIIQGLVTEHVTPTSRGGGDGVRDLVVACQRCDRKKGNRSPQEAGMTLHAPRGDRRVPDVEPRMPRN